MTKSRREPRPIVLGRYRYSKWRWRVLVFALDTFGAVAMRLWRAVRPRGDFPAPRRILLVQLDHLGDAILTSPMLERLAAAYPRAAIDVLASPSNRAVFEANPQVRRVHVAAESWFERGQCTPWRLVTAVWRLGCSLRGERYDLGIDVRGDVLSVLVLALAGIPRRLGWTMGGGGFLLTDVARWVAGRHEVESRLALLARLNVAVEGPVNVVIHVTDEDRVRVGRLLRRDSSDRSRREAVARLAAATQHGPSKTPGTAAIGNVQHAGRRGNAVDAPMLAIHLGAGTAAKRWPIGHWKILIGRFLADGWRIAIVGGGDEVATAQAMGNHERLAVWAGALSVTETAALIERADLFLGADSGPSHLAACAGIPSVILFSGTNRHRQWRPWSLRSLVLRRRVPCQPCHHKACPLAEHPCMTGIAPQRVYEVARRWWLRMHRQGAAPPSRTTTITHSAHAEGTR
jgi:heptosyltransferase-2